MAWTWRYEDAEGVPVEHPSEAFTGQGDAESWLGQTWKEAVAAGAVTAVLMDGDQVEYRMSLLAP